MRPNQQLTADKIVAIARELIQETGDFDLPMRELAARAQVSLRTPYQIFGSKSGVINAILMRNQKLFRTLSTRLSSVDEVENIFDRVRLGIGFFADDQPFFRALFRATQGYDGRASDPASDNLRSFQILCMRASRAGLIVPDADIAIVGETLSDIFAANVRRWARGDFDIALVDLKIGFGFASVLSSVTEGAVSDRLRLRMLDFQRRIQAFETAASRIEAAA